MIQASSSTLGRAEGTVAALVAAAVAGCGDALPVTSMRRPSRITARTLASPNTSAARSGGSSTSTGT